MLIGGSWIRVKHPNKPGLLAGEVLTDLAVWTFDVTTTAVVGVVS